jgi:hypothetical protein
MRADLIVVAVRAGNVVFLLSFVSRRHCMLWVGDREPSRGPPDFLAQRSVRMQNYMVGAVDWNPRWVRSVVCGDTGEELRRAVWPRDEAEDHLVAFFQTQRETYGIPLVVTGRRGSHWPNSVLKGCWLAGFAVELYDGSPLGRMLRIEHQYREDLSYRSAALLAAVYLARHKVGWVDATFVLEWLVRQTRQRLDELGLELESSHPQWDDRGTEVVLQSNLPPVVFSQLVRTGVVPL